MKHPRGPERGPAPPSVGDAGRRTPLGRLLFLAAWVALATALVGTACGGTDTPTPASTPSPTATTVQADLPAAPPTDIAEVLISGPDVVDITPRSANLTAVSNTDLVCAVAYGLTTDYGQIATDTDMAGGGHSDHHPRLTGLEPDTVYHYRLGGIGPDVTVYRSQDLTFRTPPAEAGTGQRPSGDNLASLANGARVIGVSSNFGGDNTGAWGANSTLDGSASTAWSSNGDGNEAWIEIELPDETHVTAIGFWTRTMGSSAEVFSFAIVTDLGETHGPFNLDGADVTKYIDTDFVATRLRFQAIETSGGNVGAIEIEVFGDQASDLDMM